MTNSNESFASLMLAFRGRHDLKVVFNDFLTVVLSQVTFDPDTGVPCEEEQYSEIIARYRPGSLHTQFPRMLDALVYEMGERYQQSLCPDILGEFYQTYIHTRNDTRFVTSWDESLTLARKVILPLGRGHSILADRGVTSGRMLLAGALVCGNEEPIYGISHRLVCVKTTVVNLLFSKVCNAEVMWADAENKADFKLSYKLSKGPYGVYRITKKEESAIWNVRQSGMV